jgi:hypothetical protein
MSFKGFVKAIQSPLKELLKAFKRYFKGLSKAVKRPSKCLQKAFKSLFKTF